MLIIENNADVRAFHLQVDRLFLAKINRITCLDLRHIRSILQR
jgi:hypothetical protein